MIVVVSVLVLITVLGDHADTGADRVPATEVPSVRK